MENVLHIYLANLIATSNKQHSPQFMHIFWIKDYHVLFTEHTCHAQAEFENGIEDENNFQIQEIDFQNGIDEDDA